MHPDLTSGQRRNHVGADANTAWWGVTASSLAFGDDRSWAGMIGTIEHQDLFRGGKGQGTAFMGHQCFRAFVSFSCTLETKIRL